jgi:hypothetical protein
MAKWHEAETSQKQLLGGYALSLLATIAIFLSGVFKIFPIPQAIEPLEKLDLAPYALWVGLAEVVLVLFYWLPPTSRLGFFLICSYIGAILMGEILMGEFPFPALLLGCMIYFGTYFRMPSLFRGVPSA